MKKLLFLVLVMAGGLPAFGQARRNACPEYHLPRYALKSVWVDRDGQARTLADLKSILRDHAQWLREHKDFSIAKPTKEELNNRLRADLSGAQLTYIDLRGAVLSFANLDRSDLSFANFAGADLRGASLNKSCLSKTDLTGANLENAGLADSDLEGALMSKAELAGTDLTKVLFEPKTIPAASGIARAEGLNTLQW